jgi:amidohydrolase
MYKADSRALACIEKYYDACRELSEFLLLNPEVGGQEKNAVEYLEKLLRSLGYEVIRPYVGVSNSFLAVGVDRLDFDGPRAVLMCEYDALPELGHACGHALSCGASVLAGLALKETYPDLPFRVDLMGTPAEENLGGKILIREAGGFKNYSLAAMAHLFNEDVADYKILASNDRYYTFRGKSSHASSAPQNGTNALNAARLFMDAMDMWRQHIPYGCQHHGIITYGGDAPNIVPERVELDWYFRAEHMPELRRINEIADNCAYAAAFATETTVDIVQRCPDYCDLSCDDYKSALLKEHFALTGRTHLKETKAAGSGDVGNVDLDMPVFHPMIDAVSGDKSIGLHTKAFEAGMHTALSQKAMKDGAVILMTLIHRLATEPETFQRLSEAHKAYRTGQV